MSKVEVVSMIGSEIIAFLEESNKIEGITRSVYPDEVTSTITFLQLANPKIPDLEHLVHIYQPDAILRRTPDLDVFVGRHIAPQGGPQIVSELQRLLDRVIANKDPYTTHIQYEMLHPFTDGNGRSGRALWAWQMLRLQGHLALGFLHQWYYQSLGRERKDAS